MENSVKEEEQDLPNQVGAVAVVHLVDHLEVFLNVSGTVGHNELNTWEKSIFSVRLKG